MAVGTEVVAVRYEDIAADTPISVPYPVYEALDILVYNGAAALQAVFNTDYTVSLADDFDTFTLTPTASLLTKINDLIAANPDSEANYITVRRRLDYLTDSTAAAVRYTPFTSREFERTVLRFQQIQEQLNRALVLAPSFVGDQPLLQLLQAEPNRVLVFNDAADGIDAGPTITQIEGAEDQAVAAAASAAAAATSETNAADSATAAADSATAAATSETNAADSATAAATSETNAATSETNAANYAAAAEAAAAINNWMVDTFAGTGAEATYVLTQNPGTINNTFVTVDGVAQHQDTYTLVGTALTMTAPDGADIEVRYGTALEVAAPAANSVGTSALQNGAATKAKIGSNAIDASKIDGSDAAAIITKLGISPSSVLSLGIQIDTSTPNTTSTTPLGGSLSNGNTFTPKKAAGSKCLVVAVSRVMLAAPASNDFGMRTGMKFYDGAAYNEPAVQQYAQAVWVSNTANQDYSFGQVLVSVAALTDAERRPTAGGPWVARLYGNSAYAGGTVTHQSTTFIFIEYE